MDLNFTPEEEAFRAEVQAFLRDKLPARIANKVKAGQRLTKADQEEWHAILNARGWLANHWPEQYGGPGWGAVQKFIFDNECALAGGPRIARATPSQARARTWPRSRPRRCAAWTRKATTTSSTAKRPGRPRASTPT